MPRSLLTRCALPSFAEHVHAGQGEIFLCLHLWVRAKVSPKPDHLSHPLPPRQYYNTIALLYREPFLHARAEYAQLSLSEATEIQKSAVRYIQEITVTIPSEHVAVLYNNPFINTCYYVAACCWISDLVEHSSSATGARAINGNNGAASAGHPFARARSLLATTAHSNFTACVKVLRNFSQLWLGVGWIAAALAKRSQGLSLQDVIKAGVTDTILSEAEMVSAGAAHRGCDEGEVTGLTLILNAASAHDLGHVWRRRRIDHAAVGRHPELAHDRLDQCARFRSDGASGVDDASGRDR